MTYPQNMVRPIRGGALRPIGTIATGMRANKAHRCHRNGTEVIGSHQPYKQRPEPLFYRSRQHCLQFQAPENSHTNPSLVISGKSALVGLASYLVASGEPALVNFERSYDVVSSEAVLSFRAKQNCPVMGNSAQSRNLLLLSALAGAANEIPAPASPKPALPVEPARWKGSPVVPASGKLRGPRAAGGPSEP